MKLMKINLIGLVFLGTGATPLGVLPQMDTRNEVLSKIHQMNRNEIRLGELATSKGLTDEVKNYGDLLARDYKLIDRKVMAFAQRNGILLTRMDSKKSSEFYQNLDNLSGSEFDQAYLGHMKEDHDKDFITLPSTSLTLGQRGRTRELVYLIIPILKQHQQLANNISRAETKMLEKEGEPLWPIAFPGQL